jgi:uncharacterized membrane protein
VPAVKAFYRRLKHLLTGRAAVRRAFPPASLAAIEAAIAAAECTHAGQIRFAVEPSLEGAALLAGQGARERAVDVFSLLRVWDTAHNNGVLIYLLLADRDVEIVADRGIHACCGAAAWESICERMEARFRQGLFEQGVIEGIAAVGAQLAAHFPPGDGSNGNELPDRPVIL